MLTIELVQCTHLIVAPVCFEAMNAEAIVQITF
jgi:hypothetical protein